MEAQGTITIICGNKECTMFNKYNSSHIGLGLNLVKELNEIVLHPDGWKHCWEQIQIITRTTDPKSPFPYNIYPGSLHAITELSSLIHSDWNISEFDYEIDFNEQTFTCNDERFNFKDLDDVQKYYELEAELSK